MKKNIYVVEDNDDIRELVEYLLDSENYGVMGFANATDFTNQMTVAHPDMIVLDVMLPDGNGIDICNRLKADQSTKNIPILLMSANTNLAQISQESMANDFLSKPFDIDDMVIRVNKLIK